MNIHCRIKGHMVACRQDATLFPEGGGLFYHQHVCLRCTSVLHTFDTTELPPEVEANIRMSLPNVNGQLVQVDVHPSYAHKNSTLVH